MNDLTVEEQQTKIENKSVYKNAVVVANIIELSVSVVSRLAGKNIADSLDNSPISRSALGNIVANRIKDKLLKGDMYDK